MTKIESLRRILLPCFTIPPSNTTSTTVTTTTSTKKRLSASLRDDVDDDNHRSNSIPTKPQPNSSCQEYPSYDSSPSSCDSRLSHPAPHRSSKSMVICTFFGERRSHVFFCVQIDRRISAKPSLLLELSLSTHNLVKEMRSGLLRIALECSRSELGSCPLHAVPLWTLFCNGRRVGSAARRRQNDDTRLMLKGMENTTVGAGVIPGSGRPGSSEVMYMRANYEWVIGGEDSESFHLMSPDDCPGQELSVFLLRSS